MSLQHRYRWAVVAFVLCVFAGSLARMQAQQLQTVRQGVLNDACLNCHLVYRDKRRPNTDAIDAANKALRCAKG
jgi:hypothetical protein